MYMKYAWIGSLAIHTAMFIAFAFLPVTSHQRPFVGIDGPCGIHNSAPAYPAELSSLPPQPRLEFEEIPICQSSEAKLLKEELVEETLLAEDLPEFEITPRKEKDSSLRRRERKELHTSKEVYFRKLNASAVQCVSTPACVSPDRSRNRLPTYPTRAQRLGQEGVVVLKVSLSDDGRVKRIEIITSSNYPLLDQSAVNGIKSWSFIPATSNGQSVKSTLVIPVRFRLEEML